MADGMEFHEVANIFPMLTGQEYIDLRESIRSLGLLNPILTYEGKILDGRNRFTACLDIGIEPRFEEWEGDDPWEFVWAENAERRHLPEGQKVIIHILKDRKRAEWLEEKLLREEEKRRKQSEASLGNKSASKNGCLSRDKQPFKPNKDNWSHTKTAKAAGVSTATAARAESLVNSRPDLAEKVAQGQMSLGEATRQKKKDEVKEVAPISGKYRVIYADPPWKYNNSGDGIDNYGPAERHYPPMSIPELCTMPIKEHAEDNAVLFLWVTSPFLEDAFKVIHAWGFDYKTSFVWDKVGHNYGHYNSVRHEFLLVCTRGSCTPDNSKLYDSVQSIEKSDKHSEKPEEFRAIIDDLYQHGNKIELFARCRKDGWDAWGNEAE